MKRQFVVLLGTRGVAAVLQAVLYGILARTVTPTTFGLVTALIGIVGVVLVATGLGMAGLISRAHARGEKDVVEGAIRLTVRSGVVTGAGLAVLVAIWASLGSMPLAAALVAIGLTIERTTDAALNVPIADGHVTLSTWPVLLRRVVGVLLLLAALKAGADPLWSYAVATLVGAAAGQWLTRRIVRPTGAGTVPYRALAQQGAPYMWNTLAAQSRMLDTAVVAAVLTPAAAASYAAASKLVQPALLVPQTIASLVLPRSARLGAAGAQRLVRPLLLACVGSLVLLLPVMLLAEPIVTLVMGHQYASSASTFRWLLAGMPFAALSAPLAAVLQGQGRARTAATNGVVFAVILLLAVWVGAVLDGPDGAAIGLSASFVARSVALLVSVRAASRSDARADDEGVAADEPQDDEERDDPQDDPA